MRAVLEMLTDKARDDAEGFPTDFIPSDDEGASMDDEASETHKSGSNGTSDVGPAEA